MKIRLEWFQEDQMEIAKRNAEQLKSVFSGEALIGENGQINELGQLVYVDKKRTSLMMRPIRKARIGR